jgi:hypothetical protein
LKGFEMPDYERAIRTAQEFDELHGGGEPPMCVDRWMYFCDGARREAHPLGVRVTTNNDAYRRGKFIVYYWQLRLDLAVAKFTELKRNLMARTAAVQRQRYCDMPPDKEAVAGLKKLRKEVKALKLKLQEAEDAMEESKPERLKKLEEFDVELREECQITEGKLRSIEI